MKYNANGASAVQPGGLPRAARRQPMLRRKPRAGFGRVPRAASRAPDLAARREPQAARRIRPRAARRTPHAGDKCGHWR